MKEVGWRDIPAEGPADQCNLSVFVLSAEKSLCKNSRMSHPLKVAWIRQRGRGGCLQQDMEESNQNPSDCKTGSPGEMEMSGLQSSDSVYHCATSLEAGERRVLGMGKWGSCIVKQGRREVGVHRGVGASRQRHGVLWDSALGMVLFQGRREPAK